MTDYQDLLRRLRRSAKDARDSGPEGIEIYKQLDDEAADAIEALLKEREERLIFGPENAWQQFSPKSDE